MLAVFGVFEEVDYSVGEPFCVFGFEQEAVLGVGYLDGYTADIGGDDGGSFPEGLGDGEAEAFPCRFLDNDLGQFLYGVYQQFAVADDEDDVAVLERGFGFFVYLVIHSEAFGVVAGDVVAEHEAAVDFLLYEFEDVYDAFGVFPWVEAGDLCDDWFVEWDADFFEFADGGFVGDFHILSAEGIDGGVHESLVDGEVVFEVLFAGEDDLVVFKDKALEEIPQFCVRVGEVYVATPYPGLAFSVGPYKGQRLGVVDDDAVVLKVGELGEVFVDLNIGAFFSFREIKFRSLEGVVEAFCYFEEFLASM